MGTVVNRALPSLYGGSLEITLTVLLRPKEQLGYFIKGRGFLEQFNVKTQNLINGNIILLF